MKMMMVGSLMILLGTPHFIALAADDKALRAERHEAQQQRQQQKNERNRQNQAALSEFRGYVRGLKKEYQELVRDLDTAYRMQKVDLKAQRDMKIADAEVIMQQNVSQLMFDPKKAGEEEAIKKFRADMKAHVDKVYEIKKQAAMDEHNEAMENENNKHKKMSERDQKALDKARALGLLKKHVPILAKPIGGKLTSIEQHWNEREQVEVEKLYESNQRQLVEFSRGTKLREWEMSNKREDFKLKWQQQDELHAINSEQVFYNSMFLAPDVNSPAKQQELVKRMTDISRQNQMIKIKYKKIRDQNRIKRNEERRKLLKP